MKRDERMRKIAEKMKKGEDFKALICWCMIENNVSKRTAQDDVKAWLWAYNYEVKDGKICEKKELKSLSQFS